MTKERRRLTRLVALLITVVALVVVSVLFRGYQRKESAVRTLRTFAERIHAGDCAGSYRLLATSARREVGSAHWCGYLDVFTSILPRGFEVEERRARDASVTIIVGGRGLRGPDPLRTWVLRRYGGEWKVELSPPFSVLGFFSGSMEAG